MEYRSCLDDVAVPIIADASVVINLIASQFANTILRQLGGPLLVVREVQLELEEGRYTGRKDAQELSLLVNNGQVEIVELGERSAEHFLELVSGMAKDTLDDGEAATIAYALESNATVLIDDRKAIRLCSTRFPHLTICNTVDLLGHADVWASLGASAPDAVFNALRIGRMRVPEQYLDWVVNEIGSDRAALCSSLPARYRGG